MRWRPHAFWFERAAVAARDAGAVSEEADALDLLDGGSGQATAAS